MIQFNFTVGVRGSISNVDRTEPLSFTSTLNALGITSRINLDRIRKVVANRTFEGFGNLGRAVTLQTRRLLTISGPLKTRLS
jgi:hypothetical protein